MIIKNISGEMITSELEEITIEVYGYSYSIKELINKNNLRITKIDDEEDLIISPISKKEIEIK